MQRDTMGLRSGGIGWNQTHLPTFELRQDTWCKKNVVASAPKGLVVSKSEYGPTCCAKVGFRRLSLEAQLNVS
jgi:hypothetical protein